MLHKTAMLAGFSIYTCLAASAFASQGREGSWHSAAQGAPDVKQCRKVVAEHPGDAIANNDLGWALRQNGDLAGAEKYLRAAIKLNPQMAQAHSNLSVVLLDRNVVAEAKSEASAAVKIDDSNPVYHAVLANALAKNDDRKAAIEQYRQAIKLKPDYENAMYNLGRVLGEDGQGHEAKYVLADALKLDPKDDRVVVLLDQLSKEGQ